MSKRVKTSVVALIVLIAAAIGYYGLYTQPMLRYRGEFYKPAVIGDAERLYVSGNDQICITRNSVTIRYHGFMEARFVFAIEGNNVTVADPDGEILLRGNWWKGRLTDETGALDASFQKLHETRIEPNAAEALEIFMTYETQTRGGGRAPRYLIGAVAVMFAAPLLFDRDRERLKMRTILEIQLENYGKSEKTEEYRRTVRGLRLWYALGLAVCAGILIYDLVCY